MKKPQQVKGLQSFYFRAEVFQFDVLIFIGAKTKKDVLRVFKKRKIDPKVTKEWLEDPSLEWLLKQDAGTLWHGDLAVIYSFKKWEDSWNFYEMIVHEVSHMVDDVAKHRNLEKETEAKAYLAEFLFKKIRKGMQDLMS